MHPVADGEDIIQFEDQLNQADVHVQVTPVINWDMVNAAGPNMPFTPKRLPFGYHATGLNSVPYDNYAAMLHKGERVLTKNEAAAYRKGGSGFASIDYARMGKEFAAAVAGMSMSMDGETVARMMAPNMDRQLGELAYAGRYNR